MTWFKVDDSFYDHPKVFDAPDCAMALWVRAGAWSARNLTDGFVPAGMPARLCDDHDTAVKELVRRGLWLRITGGFRFHDWADFQPSGESVISLKAKRAEAGRKGGQAKAANQNGKQTSSKAVASASGDAKQNATPTRPDPTPKEQTPSSPPATDDAFDDFWTAYPRKVGKGQARRAWTKAVKAAEPEAIVEGAQRYARERAGQDQTYTAHPATWLNGERWTDQPTEVRAAASGDWWEN